MQDLYPHDFGFHFLLFLSSKVDVSQDLKKSLSRDVKCVNTLLLCTKSAIAYVRCLFDLFHSTCFVLDTYSGMSVLDKEKLKNYVRDTVTERLRGIARERRERISLSAIGVYVCAGIGQCIDNICMKRIISKEPLILIYVL